jgi:hypothetical protein
MEGLLLIAANQPRETRVLQKLLGQAIQTDAASGTCHIGLSLGAQRWLATELAHDQQPVLFRAVTRKMMIDAMRQVPSEDETATSTSVPGTPMEMAARGFERAAVVCRVLVHALAQVARVDFALLVLRDFLALCVLPAISPHHWMALVNHYTVMASSSDAMPSGADRWSDLSDLPLSALLLRLEAVLSAHVPDASQSFSSVLSSATANAVFGCPRAHGIAYHDAAATQQAYESELTASMAISVDPAVSDTANWRCFQHRVLLLHVFQVRWFETVLDRVQRQLLMLQSSEPDLTSVALMGDNAPDPDVWDHDTHVPPIARVDTMAGATGITASGLSFPMSSTLSEPSVSPSSPEHVPIPPPHTSPRERWRVYANQPLPAGQLDGQGRLKVCTTLHWSLKAMLLPRIVLFDGVTGV